MCVPQSETRARVKNDDGIVLDGMMPIAGAQTAVFLHAFENNKPRVLKIPHQQRKAFSECQMFEEIGIEAVDKNIPLVPVKALSLVGSHRSSLKSPEKQLSHGILMPIYCCTLENLPTPISENMARNSFHRLSNALEFLHSKDWMHGDVKPTNILISENGEAWLGDYGSSVKFGDLKSYTGGTLQYQCSDLINRDGIVSPRKFDKIGLVISFLKRHISNNHQFNFSTVAEIENTIESLPIAQDLKDSYRSECSIKD